MSTTSDLRVAVKYAVSDVSVLLRLRSRSAMNRGVELAYLSAFPGEQEFLYPPLTYLKYVASDQIEIGGCPFVVLEMEPHFGS